MNQRKVPRIMGKLAIMALVVVLALANAGCVQFVYHLILNPDGSANTKVKFGMNSALRSMAASEGDGDPIVDFRQGAVDQGYQVKNYADGDITGVILTKHYDSVGSMPKEMSLFNGEAGAPNRQPKLKVSRNFFKTRYVLDDSIDMADITQDDASDPEQQQIAQAAISQFDMRFQLTMPIQSLKNNATKVFDDGKTLEWRLVPGEKNRVHVEAETLNVRNIALLMAAIVVIMVIAAVTLVLGLRRRGGTNLKEHTQ